MGEEALRDNYEDLVGGHGMGHGDDDRDSVTDWEVGLPSLDDLTPLSQPLVPPNLASAFSISPEPARTILDVHRASQKTLSSLRRPPNPDPNPNPNPSQPENQEPDADDPSARALKRPRLVWTPQLHKRFVDVVAHVGIKNAVPKMIMQLMNVEGLTRENVASHLQKYRLYLKTTTQGLSNEGPSPSDQLFSSTPVPPSLQEVTKAAAAAPAPPPPQQPMPYVVPTMFPIYSGGHNTHTGMVPVNNSYQHYGGFADQGGRIWPTGGSKFGSFVSYPPRRVSPNDN